MVIDSTAFFFFYFFVSSNNRCLQNNAREVGMVAQSMLSTQGDMQKGV